MSDTITFTTSDNKFQFTAKSDFLKRCPKPQEEDVYNLMTRYGLGQYIHSTTGPAVIINDENKKEYWINGKELSPEESAKIEHSHNFNSKLSDTLNEE